MGERTAEFFEAFTSEPCNICGGKRNWQQDGQLQAVCYRCGHPPAALPSDSEEAAGPRPTEEMPFPDSEVWRCDHLYPTNAVWRCALESGHDGEHLYRNLNDESHDDAQYETPARLRSSPSVPESAATLREAAQQVVDGARHARFCAVYDPSGASACDCGLAALRAALSGGVPTEETHDA